jgi:hypothetical protein
LHAVARWFRIFYCAKSKEIRFGKQKLYLGIQLLQNHARDRIGAELVRSEVAQYSCYQWKANGRADLKQNRKIKTSTITKKQNSLK